MEMHQLIMVYPKTSSVTFIHGVHSLSSFCQFSLTIDRMKCKVSYSSSHHTTQNTRLQPDGSNNSITASPNGEELSSELYNTAIRNTCRVGDADKAMAILAQMEALGFRPSSMSYTHLIEALGNLGRTLEADAIFQEMIASSSSSSSGFVPRLTVCNVLLKGFLRKGQLGLADKVLTIMDDLDIRRNQETYRLLLDYHVRAGRLNDTWSVINKMKLDGFRPNSFVYSKVIGLYRDNGMWKKALGIVEEIREMGVSLDKRIYNSIVDTFGKFGELSDALEVFEKMQQEGIRPDITTWNSLIQWHCRAGDLYKALELLTEMQEQGLYPDPKIFVTIISRLGEQGKWDVIKKNFENMKCRGHQRSGAIYAVLVDIYGQYGKFQDAQECISALKSEGIEPSASMFCVLANAYAQQGRCEQTVKVLQLMEGEGIEPNLIMLNVLINAFGIAGRHMEALSVYHHIKESGISPDIVTYSTLMKAFIRARKFEKVPEIYEEMESVGCTPDRKAREMLQAARMALEQRQCKYKMQSASSMSLKVCADNALRIISPFQATFVSGRQIAENIVLTQEIIHTFKKRRGKKGEMAIKSDMAKVYDRLEWNFIETTLRNFGFHRQFIGWIMECVSTTQLSILINGGPLGMIQPSRGIRRDPISPLLFIICTEVLSRLLLSEERRGRIHGVRIGRNGPPISHLMFADDLVLFGPTSISKAENLNKCVDQFCSWSGLEVC